MIYYPFLYTTPTQLALAGVPATIAVDTQWYYISMASAYINKLTGQYFCPVVETKEWDGNSHPIIHDDTLIPIAKITSVTVDSSRTNNRDYPLGRVFSDVQEGFQSFDLTGFLSSFSSTYTYSNDDYVNQGRFIELPHSIFPGGAKNVSVDGVFGWLDNVKDASTTTATNIVTDGTTVTLTDGSDFENGDVLIIGDNELLIPNISIVGNAVTFSSVGTLQATISSGATVTSYGRVPSDIQMVTDLAATSMAANWSSFYTSPTTGDIKKEKTDRYSYELFGDGQSFDILGIGTMIEEVITRYQAPPLVEFV